MTEPGIRMVQGVSVPAFFYGTAWKEERTEELTRLALRSGFRALDTANQRRHYVEAAVGAAVGAVLGEGELVRGDLFLQTKFTYARGQDHRLPYEPNANVALQVVQSLDSSLAHLGTSYVDSYLLHGPSNESGFSATDLEVWGAMEELQRAGKARLIGVSNVSQKQLAELVRRCQVCPAFVQNRCYARGSWDREIRALCRDHGIAYQGFSLLTANQKELSQPAIVELVRRTGRTLPQVVFRFALQLGMIPLTGTSSALHQQQDLECFNFELQRDAVATLERVGG